MASAPEQFFFIFDDHGGIVVATWILKIIAGGSCVRLIDMKDGRELCLLAYQLGKCLNPVILCFHIIRPVLYLFVAIS